MQVSLKDGKLTIVIDANTKDPQPSTSGKSLVVASSHGNQQTSLTVNGFNVSIGLNAFVKNPDYIKAE